MSIEQSVFPEMLKCAEVTPIFKKNDMLDKKIYRPVSVLPCLSKVFEGLLIDQMTRFFDTLLSHHLSGFRKGYSCQSVLLRFVESCKYNLDNGKICGTLLTDLSKAFDCLPHCLLISKLNAYGVDSKSCELIASYFKRRKQRVNIGNSKSDWLELSKGAPQGSLFGPFAYNLFTNDLIHLIVNMGFADLFNYADDNTVSCYDKDIDTVRTSLQRVSDVMLKWFNDNYMQANPDKFQLIIFGASDVTNNSVNINGNNINAEQNVVLLGVGIDQKLNFSKHIADICKKAGRKLNVLARMANTLDTDGKMCIFQCFIMSHFNYCPLVWHCCKIGDMKKIEKIQERALRYVFNDFNSSYSELRSKANRPLLYVQRLRSLVVEVYKILNNQSPAYLNDLFIIKESQYELRNILPLQQPKYNTMKYGLNSLAYQGASLWNTLDNDIKQANTLKELKNALLFWEGPQCNCTNCKFCSVKNM
jgi:hypothetical protein